MKISEEIYEKMPDNLKVLFECVHNSSCPEAEFAKYGERKSGQLLPHHKINETQNNCMTGKNYPRTAITIGDSGSASRFFYSAKASKHDRMGSKHPTVKPINLMRYLCRLVTPYGGVVLDPFAGSGTTGHAAILEGFKPIMIEREEEYYSDIIYRMNHMKMDESKDDNQLNLFNELEDGK